MHAAIWIDGEVKEDQIVGTAPRAEHCRTRGEKLWRRFVLKVQRHDCRPKCFTGGLNDSEDGDSATCKYGYPRERCFKAQEFNETTQRFKYRCEQHEDERLSPYIPLWLLATGALKPRLRHAPPPPPLRGCCLTLPVPSFTNLPLRWQVRP